jgi:hypothetical protein
MIEHETVCGTALPPFLDAFGLNPWKGNQMATKQTEVESDDIDRSPPIAIFLSGESFFRSAQYLRRGLETNDLRLRFNMPIYYLYSHALELTLKAFLRTRGVAGSRLASREFGHKLQALWDACIAQGLSSQPVADAFIALAIEILDPFATDFEFRYVKVGLKSLPTLETVESAVADVMVAVRPYCDASVSGATPD